MIEIENLSFAYGSKYIIKNINLTIPKNTTYAIIGSSGCGKTTLLYNLAGILMPSIGKIFIEGEMLKGVRRQTGVILQNFGLLPWKTVENNIRG